MEPPLPLQHPVTLPNSSAMISSAVSPLASAWPWGLWVEVITSSGPRAAHTPTAQASSPWYW